MTRAPFKLLDFYRFEDADLFFGREEETRRMTGEILSTRLLALFSPSGSGKTSLINAGVRPLLEKMGYETVYTRLEDAPIPSICRAVSKELGKTDPKARARKSGKSSAAGAAQDEQQDLHGFLKQAAAKIDKPLVIFLDQFEEFFLALRNRPEMRRDFIRQLARVKYDDELPVFLVLSLREDYFANLHEFREAIPSIFQNNANTRLQPFSDDQARRAIEGPLKTVGWSIEPGLVDVLITDLKKEGEGIEPIALQLVCGTLWEKAQGEKSNQITLALYRVCGGADTILQNFIEARLQTIPRRQQPLMARILAAMKTPDNTKRLLTFGDLKKELKIKREQRLDAVLEKLAGLDILRSEKQAGTRWYEFKHDYLAPRIVAWLQQRREKKMRRRQIFIGLPGIIFFLVVCSYFFIQYNTFYAGFDYNQVYEDQQKEIVISRGFNPFNWRIGTGFLSKSDLDATARGIIDARFRIGAWDKDDWTKLAGILESPNGGKILYLSGHKREGIKNILRAIEYYRENRDIKKDISFEFEYHEALRTAAALVDLYPDVIDELIKILRYKDSDLRDEAALALGQIGKGNEQAMAGLINALKDKDSDVRIAASEVLGKIGAGNKQAIAGLFITLNDKDSSVRRAAAAALGQIGKGNDQAIAGLMNALKDEDEYVCRDAASALGQIGQGNDQAIAGLIKLLQDEYSSVRSEAAKALGEAGAGNDQAIAGLTNALKDKDRDVREAAAAALGKIGKGNDQAMAGLINALKDEDEYVCMEAASALGQIGKGNDQAVAGLINALQDKDGSVRRAAAAALGQIGQGNDQAIAVLINALKDKEWDVREAAAEALGQIGKGNEQAIFALIKALQDKKWSVRWRAADALGKIGQGNEQAIASLKNALKDKDILVRINAEDALGKIGKGNEQAIAGLLNALQDEDVRKNAAWALGKFLEKKSDQELLAMLRHHESKDRIVAAHALAQKTKLDKSTLTEIKRLVKDENEPIWARLAALDCIAFILAKEKEKK